MTAPTLTWENGQLVLAGPVTIATVTPLLKQLRATLATAPAGQWLLDGQGITLTDSAVIALLLEIHRQAEKNGAALTVTGLRQQLVSLMAIYGVEWLLARDPAP